MDDKGTPEEQAKIAALIEAINMNMCFITGAVDEETGEHRIQPSLILAALMDRAGYILAWGDEATFETAVQRMRETRDFHKAQRELIDKGGRLDG